MKLGFDITIEQSQKLIMTPELRQAIELLQFNTTELTEYINNELEENPMLEYMENERKEESLDEYAEKDVDWAEYFEKNDNSSYRVQTDKNIKQQNFETFTKENETLDDFLLRQVNLSDLNEQQKEIGKILIRSLDKDGYLDLELKEISGRLGVNKKEIKRVLSKIQKFDPPGIAARNLKECLLIQIDELECDKLYIRTIIEDHLEDLAYNRIDKISKSVKIDVEDVKQALEYIKKLEPKPGRYLSNKGEEARVITPDAEIKLVDGRYSVILNDVTAPRLNINNFYRNMLKNNSDDKAVEYLSGRFNRALWVIRSIEQRRDTIRKILESILKFQKEFFIEGERHLKPLTMKEVADDIEMHESTVSRASNEKYVQTPRGLFQMKYFFTSGVDGDISSTSIKVIIKDIIDNEQSNKPYSDQKISDLLKEKEIKISRRTVAKYRDEMNILSSSLRRK